MTETTKAAIKAAFKAIGNVVAVDPGAIKVDTGFNFRKPFDPVANVKDAELVASLRARGFRGDPLILRRVGSDVYLVNGHRRLAAILAIGGFKTVPCIFETSGTTDQERDADQITYNTGVEYDPAEQGAVYARMRSRGWKDTEIAARFGKVTKWIAECVKASRLDPRLTALIKAGTVSATLALEIVAAHGAENAPAIVKAAADLGTGKKTGRATGASVAKVTGKAAKNAKGPVAPAPVAPVTGKLAGAMAVLHGPFIVGKDMDDCTIFDANGTELAEFAEANIARAACMCINQGWHTYTGKPVAPAPATAKPDPVAPDTAPVAVIVAASANGAANGKAKGARK